MKKSMKRLLIVLAILLLLFLGVSWFIGHQIVLASTNLVTNEQTMALYEGSWALEGFDFDSFSAAYHIQPLALDSSLDGHHLPFDLITADGNRDIVVMAHGMMGNRLTNYPTAQIFLENGCNVITYDQRSSGGNEAQGSTFGYLEKYDLTDCVQYARQHFPDARIFVWGESFGGATALLAAAQESVQQELSGLILDCPVSSMAYMVQASMEEMGIPLPMGYLLACGNLVNQMELHFSYADVDCAGAAAHITVPTLVFRSMADTITPAFMGEEIYNRLASPRKELYTSQSCEHIEIRNHEREAYTEKVASWIR